MADYFVKCECGLQQNVAATHAGSTLNCNCGRSVEVPLLSVLRKSAGQSAIPKNIVRQIEEMLRDGILSTADVCNTHLRETTAGISRRRGFAGRCRMTERTVLYGLVRRT